MINRTRDFTLNLTGASRIEWATLVRVRRLTAAESRTLLAAYDAGLTGYTYLET
jgi:hypothetical protein